MSAEWDSLYPNRPVETPNQGETVTTMALRLKQLFWITFQAGVVAGYALALPHGWRRRAAK